MKNTLALLLAVMVLQCVWSPSAAGQVGNTCLGVFGNGWTLFGGCPPGTITFYIEGPILVNCVVWTYHCPPIDAGPETCPGCATAAASHPISLASGNTYIKETDVSLPGLSGGLQLVRMWNSMWPSTQTAYQIGMFGPNWRSNFEEHMFVGSDYYIKYARGDGSFWSFGYGPGTNLSVAAPANITASLVMGSSYWTLTFQNGEQRLFDNLTGRLITIIDRNGNTTQLSYDGLGRLVAVTDPVSRHLYFGYSGSGSLVTSLTSDVGISLSYSYDGEGRLTQVTEPDSSTLNFAYNSASLISSVTDTDGHTLESHTYDSSGRGLTASRAGGVDGVTVSY